MAIKILSVHEDILSANDTKAKENLEFLTLKGILMINIMASPGSGKTSILLNTIDGLAGKANIGVIEGDVASSVDAEKISEKSVPVVQINTAGGCHLEANQVELALKNLPVDELDLIFIENVGNLICPAGFALGEQKRVMILSTPEGHDKPYKYPNMFLDVDVVLVNKIDLSPLLDFDMEEFISAVKGLNPDVEILQVSAKTGDGMDKWHDWLEKQLEGSRS